MSAPALTSATLYERDFLAWLEEQRRALQDRRLAAIDADNLAEELRDLGNSERDEVESRLEVLIQHLLKLRHTADPAPRRGWILTIREQRRRLDRSLRRSPSLVPYAESILGECYEAARGDAILAADLDPAAVPMACPWGLDEILRGDLPG